jgi:hypothetical protein
MNPWHVTLSVLNLLCLASAIIGITAHIPTALAFGVFVGYFVNLLAVAVAIGVVILLAVRARSDRWRRLFESSWLGLVNGAVVLLAWLGLFAVGKLPGGTP